MTNQNDNNSQNDNQQNGNGDDNYDDVSRMNLVKGHCFFFSRNFQNGSCIKYAIL